ncbi:MAG: N-6 DNA methylase [Kiritimatiellae bacterium]|nr:N-6 DNA methylase [Kiritimatiellia bacterium]
MLDSKPVTAYLHQVARLFPNARSKERAYRADLQNLLGQLLPSLTVIHEPSGVTGGDPDFLIENRNHAALCYLETKDIGTDLAFGASATPHDREQFDRYRAAFATLVYTDYLTFRFYRGGTLRDEIRIADIDGLKITPLPDACRALAERLADFTARLEPVKTAACLASLMASKARLVQRVVLRALREDGSAEESDSLRHFYGYLKSSLMADLTEHAFADVYAQTMAYGLFAARVHDTKPKAVFSLERVCTLIPASNSLLRRLFQNIANLPPDSPIRLEAAGLAEIFAAADMPAILEHFGDPADAQHDPFVHFYETFLSEYDAALRKVRGVWYTPNSVVRYIVRAVDACLKRDFGLPAGLADTSKTTVPVTRDGQTVSETFHKVQILDPAVGTGTFLAETIRHIHAAVFKDMQGAWPGYVEQDLIPRLNGFEILIASYAMAHLKLYLTLKESGCRADKQRLRIYLTNTLEPHGLATGTLFDDYWVAQEVRQADAVKRDTPVMVVLGNPPYSGESANKSDWIMGLMEDYKKEPGGKDRLNERNPKWVNDYYVKFIRFAESLIERTREGIVAFINNHGFLDNPTFRGMRWRLLSAFDAVYILDLHGNSKRKETAPGGGRDENVFDIQQGVSINLFVKTGQKRPGAPGRVFHADLYGTREEKYAFLDTHGLADTPFKELTPASPEYFFVPRDTTLEAEYKQGFAVDELFPMSAPGIVTARDSLTIQFTCEELKKNIHEFSALTVDKARADYSLGKNARDWSVEGAQRDLIDSKLDDKLIVPYHYRPFDIRYTYYTGKTKGFICMPRGSVMKHMIDHDNIAMLISRQAATDTWTHVQVTQQIADNRIHYSNKGIPLLCPLYLFHTDAGGLGIETREPNLNPEIVARVAEAIGAEPGPLALFDYVYAVLHAPDYRARYQTFLKSDFPRVPVPSGKAAFKRLAAVGARLRALHLLEETDAARGATYPEPGGNAVEKIRYGDGRVWISETQYFGNVSERAWGFIVGGYQPAGKWLKDRVGRTLTYADIAHYARLVAALDETAEIMEKLTYR